ncbi:MAG: helix-turn-helix transcriptional regulator [Bacteroidales bacterium]|nr:helix-turn-helix transcriptional regulator [Bacteroidales bacterium]
MKTFGKYIRELRETQGLLLRKVAAVLDIDTSILSKIERNERRATIKMLPVFSEILNTPEKDIQIEFIKSLIISDLGELKYLEAGLKETLKLIKEDL